MSYVITRKSEENELFHSDEFLGVDFSDEIYHWKYIKKKKVNGKWRYYYDRSELDKYDQEYSNERTTYKNVNGRTEVQKKTKTQYNKTNNWLDSTSKLETTSGVTSKGDSIGYKKVTYTKSQGKLSRAQAKGEKKIYDTFLSNKSTVKKTMKKASKKINRGKSAISKLLKKHS